MMNEQKKEIKVEWCDRKENKMFKIIEDRSTTYTLKNFSRNTFRQFVVWAAKSAFINSAGTGIGTFTETLARPGRLPFATITARTYGMQTDIFVNNRYLTTMFHVVNM